MGERTCAVLVMLLLNGAALGLCAQLAQPASAQQQVPLPEIVERMSQNDMAQARELKQYTSIRSYRLHNRRFNKTAEMTVRLTYSYPGRKVFDLLSESGPRPVRDRVLRRMVESEAEASGDELRRFNQLTSENYDFRFLRHDRESDRPVYVLEAHPKTSSKYLIRGQVWVDAEDFGVLKIVGQPAKNPSFWIRNSRIVYRYAKFDSFWLPVSTDSEADALVFGHTEVKIRYQDYQINSDQGVSSRGR